MSANQRRVVLEIQQSGDRRRLGEIAQVIGFVNDDTLKCFAEYVDTTRGALPRGVCAITRQER